MSITIDQLKATDLGYLSGADLLQWCPAQLLIKQYQENNDSLQTAADFAYSELQTHISNRYDIKAELLKTGAARNVTCVQITAILAIANVLGNVANVSEYQMQVIKDNKKRLLDIRNAQSHLSLPAPPVAASGNTVNTIPELISTSFLTQG